MSCHRSRCMRSGFPDQPDQRRESFRQGQHLRRNVGLPDPERRGFSAMAMRSAFSRSFLLGAQPLDGVPSQVRARFHHAQVAVVRLAGCL